MPAALRGGALLGDPSDYAASANSSRSRSTGPSAGPPLWSLSSQLPMPCPGTLGVAPKHRRHRTATAPCTNSGTPISTAPHFAHCATLAPLFASARARLLVEPFLIMPPGHLRRARQNQRRASRHAPIQQNLRPRREFPVRQPANAGRLLRFCRGPFAASAEQFFHISPDGPR